MYKKMCNKTTLKQRLRKQFKALRDSTYINFDDVGREVVERLEEVSLRPRTIFCYVSFGSEVPTHEYIKTMIGHGKTVCVPRVAGKEMQAIKISNLHELELSRMRILEPVSGEVIDSKDIDLIVVPILAFNKGYRLGYGGGFYDKYMRGCGAHKVGLAYPFQETAEVFDEAHDVMLDKIITMTT